MNTPLLRRVSVSNERVLFSHHTPPARTAALIPALGWCAADRQYIAAAVFGVIGALIAVLNPFMVRLTADRRGIRISNWLSGGNFDWSEVADVDLVPGRSRGHVIQVTSTAGERVKALATFTGSRGGQGHSYLDMSEVVDQLNAFKRAAQPAEHPREEPQVECPACGVLNDASAVVCHKCHSTMPVSAASPAVG